MNAESSLRLLIEKWLAPTVEKRIQLTRFSGSRFNRGRYVRVEAPGPAGSIGFFSFSTMMVLGAFSRRNASAQHYTPTQLHSE